MHTLESVLVNNNYSSEIHLIYLFTYLFCTLGHSKGRSSGSQVLDPSFGASWQKWKMTKDWKWWLQRADLHEQNLSHVEPQPSSIMELPRGLRGCCFKPNPKFSKTWIFMCISTIVSFASELWVLWTWELCFTAYILRSVPATEWVLPFVATEYLIVPDIA